MKVVLVDTPVWVDHFRNRNENLVSLLTLDLVAQRLRACSDCLQGSTANRRSRAQKYNQTCNKI